MMNENLRFARLVSGRVRPEKLEEFLASVKTEVYPRLERRKGLRRIYLLSDHDKINEYLSLTLWDTKEDADAYEKEGDFSSNMALINEMLQQPATVSNFNIEFHHVNEELPLPEKAVVQSVSRPARRKKSVSRKKRSKGKVKGKSRGRR
jgi:heme-degrading monooxygenase HmoA